MVLPERLANPEQLLGGLNERGGGVGNRSVSCSTTQASLPCNLWGGFLEDRAHVRYHQA